MFPSQSGFPRHRVMVAVAFAKNDDSDSGSGGRSIYPGPSPATRAGCLTR